MEVLEKAIGENKTKQLHVLPVCLKNEIIIGIAGNVLLELTNTAKIFFLSKTYFFELCHLS